MGKRRSAVALAMLGIAGASAAANLWNGSQLYEHLLKDDRSPEYTTAQGYIMGVLDANDGIAFCMPGGFAAGQAFALVKDRLEAHPESRHLPADTLVNAAMRERYPCKP